MSGIRVDELVAEVVAAQIAIQNMIFLQSRCEIFGESLCLSSFCNFRSDLLRAVDLFNAIE